jgi:hypothetical protein
MPRHPCAHGIEEEVMIARKKIDIRLPEGSTVQAVAREALERELAS